MQARIEVTIPNGISPQSIPEIKTREPHDVLESDEVEVWDDTDWQDFLSYHAGVSR